MCKASQRTGVLAEHAGGGQKGQMLPLAFDFDLVTLLFGARWQESHRMLAQLRETLDKAMPWGCWPAV